MRIVVTGREGQLVRSLLERGQGRDIVALGRPELDLETPGSARATILAAKPDLVINAAAYTNVDAAEDETERATRINGDGAAEVAAAAREAGAPVIQISTDYVFDGSAAEPYSEDAPTNPLGAYGRSKLAGEEQVRAANPDHVIVRTAWVYSPFGRNFVKTMMTLAETRDQLNVVADQRGNPSSAFDLADGLLSLADTLARDNRAPLGRTYHLAGTGPTTWFDFATRVFAECARLGLPSATATPIPTSAFPTKAKRPSNSMLGCARFERDTGFRMPDWRVSVAGVVDRIARDTRRASGA